MEQILLLAFCLLCCIACLIIGVGVGMKASRGEEIKLPNPVQKVQEFKDTREYRKQQDAVETMLYNIDVYDGTGLGQKDIEP